MRGQNDSHNIQKDRQLTGDRSLITQGTEICSNKKGKIGIRIRLINSNTIFWKLSQIVSNI